MCPALRVLSLASALLAGCAYGFRGSVESQAVPAHPAVVQGAVTFVSGFGVTEGPLTARRSNGLLVSGTFAAGTDTSGSAVVSGLGGLEWFSVPEHPASRWGYYLGLQDGVRASGQDTRDLDFVLLLRGGPVFRLRDRVEPAPLVILSIDATLGSSIALNDSRGLGVIGGLGVSVGLLRVGRFHL